MDVVVRYIDKTSLDEEAFIKIVKKYAKTKKNILIVFDNRYKDWGSYRYVKEKKLHEIRLGLKPNQGKIPHKRKKMGEQEEKYNFIATLLHEIKHLMQKEELGEKFWDEKFRINADLKNDHFSVEYSQCELEAKQFENKNVLKAVEFYDSILEE